jgi:guanylate kinase
MHPFSSESEWMLEGKDIAKEGAKTLTPDRGMLLIISGPSGVGKTTISRAVEKAFGGVLSVSLTTRPMTETDIDGVDYHFVDQVTFDRHRQGGRFLEWAEVFDYCYGTLRAPIKKGLADGKLVILEIDVQGAIKAKQEMPDCHALFILPPDEQTLLDRLRSRRRDDESEIQRRFSKAKQEIARARSSEVYDYFVVNDDLEEAIDESILWVRQQLGTGR